MNATKKNRILVTTPINCTWPTDGSPIVFLGEWCKLFEKRPIWELLDYQVATYHWDNRKKLHRDYMWLENVYEDALLALSLELNQRHRVNKSVGYWRILVGPWLAYFIQITFDRWYMLKHVNDEELIVGVRVIKRKLGEMVPNDMSEFLSFITEDNWNEMIYGQILHCFPIKTVMVDWVVTPNGSRIAPDVKSKLTLGRIKRSFYSIANNLSKIFTRSSDFFLISTYLTRPQEFLLQLNLGLVPKLWQRITPPRKSYSAGLRDWELDLPANANNNNVDSFKSVLKRLIPMNLPIAYLEGYSDLLFESNRLGWPSKPKLIYSANNFNFDDIFKVWAAEKADCGTPLISAQHGGNYGVALWNHNERHEIEIADKYLTWGWSDGSDERLIPFGNIKGIGIGKLKGKKAENVLLVGLTLPRYSYWMYSSPVASGQMTSYFEDQFKFYRALPDDVKNKVLVRLGIPDYDLGQVARWKGCFPNVRLDLGNRPMKELITQAKIYISTYNATTYLESLSMNIPTIIFWNPEHWEIRETAREYFDRLCDAGIFHKTPENAAQHLTNIWEDPETWWNERKTQEAREHFCRRYAHLPKRPLNRLTRIFSEIAKDADNN